MHVVHTLAELRSLLDAESLKDKKVAFVPTMGALHIGHLSLINRAKTYGDIVVCSIFVNPIQFTNPSDLAKYPRTLEKDILLLEQTTCDILFAPSVEDVYPQPDLTRFDFGELERVMEGKFRPGHFNGVAVVVRRLFDMVKPHVALFGEKDFQQLAIIKMMVKQLQLPVHVIGCPTLADTDGLALSSRNTLLSAEERKAAMLIPEMLLYAKENLHRKSIPEIREHVLQQLSAHPLLRPEYFEIADDIHLQPVNDLASHKNLRAFIACYAGNTRLIDNIALQ